MLKLNLGCGGRYRSEGWVNVDFHSPNESVLAYDLRRPFPFEAEAFDVVYHSHVLEHFARDQAVSFIRECHRVLKTGGVIRVAVPDLEMIATEYLRLLDAVRKETPSAERDYDWIMLELYDQVVRSKPGGAMKPYLTNCEANELVYPVSRLGSEARRMIEQTPTSESDNKSRRTSDKPNSSLLLSTLDAARAVKQKLVSLLLSGQQKDFIELAKFRSGGEIHQWMYDEFSLARLLRSIGFVDVRRCSHLESRIPHWREEELDSEHDGSPYKPDSLFVEGLKSAAQ